MTRLILPAYIGLILMIVSVGGADEPKVDDPRIVEA
jgi:hypothetical protein